MVIGTSDLSELALGYTTYGVGDHMAHYHVNASVPKTLIQYLIRWAAKTDQFGPSVAAARGHRRDPDLAGARAAERRGRAACRGGDRPIRAARLQLVLFEPLRIPSEPGGVSCLQCLERPRSGRLARPAAAGEAPPIRPRDHPQMARSVPAAGSLQRSQFKRSALPNAPKVGSGGSLSPRGDWRAPSDAKADVWLEELKRNVPDHDLTRHPKSSTAGQGRERGIRVHVECLRCRQQ